MIWLGLLSSTRFKVTAAALGWLKFTCAPEPTLKLFQSMAARWLLCCTVKLLPLLVMAALPPTTLPPWGSCVGAGRFCACTSPRHSKPVAKAKACRELGQGFFMF